VRLSDGYGFDLSPDKKWVLVWVPIVPVQYRLVPTGAADPKPMTTPNIRQPRPVGFARNQQALICVGTTADNQPQMFATEWDGSNPRPVAPPGTLSIAVSPNGRFDVRNHGAGLQLWDHMENSGQSISHLEPNDIILAVSDDGHWIYLERLATPSVIQVLHENLQTGAMELVTEVTVDDMAGVAALNRVAITPDGKTIIFSYVRHLSELYSMQMGN